MKPALALSCFFLLGAACGPRATTLPDGGKAPFTCTTEVVSMSVTVVDGAGAPIEGATVSAKNEGTQKTVTALTSPSGVTTAVTEDIGQGTVTVSATFGSRVSDQKTVTWTCGECHCTPSPSAITLTMSP